MKLADLIGPFAMSLFVSSCQAGGPEVAEAFATYDAVKLTAFVEARGGLAGYTYGRGQNIVHAATINPQSGDAIRLAVAAGGDVDHQDADGRTPLHHAIDANLAQSAEALLQNGASTEIENEAGFSASRFCDVVLKSEPTHSTCLIVKKNK